MSEANKAIVRFSIWERIEHLVLVLSFTLLSVTGLPQKFALNPISQWIISVFGGIEGIRVVHHIAAAVFLLEAVYHLVMVGYKLYVQRKEATMIPGIKDAKDAAHWFGYNIGIKADKPKMPRYNFTEKAEYWAMLWGLLLMGLTGLMLWNPIATTKVLPGEFIPAAKAAHGMEAILAVLAIILWHFYHVHAKHFNWSMIKGVISHHEMEEEHAEELEKIRAGKLPPAPEPAVYRKRFAIFLPVAAVFSIVLVALTYFFLTFETTSLTTIPPAERVDVFVRPSPTPAPTQAPRPTAAPSTGGDELAWTGTIGPMFEEKCASCHGSVGGFNAESYEEVLKAVQPGAPAESSVVKAQEAGTHPGQFTDDELKALTDWIQAGAPEGEGGAPDEEGAAGAEGTENGVSWHSAIAQMMQEKCSACHGNSGGFNAGSYEEVIKAVQPGSPEDSLLVQSQQAGVHPGQFTEEELQVLVDWVTAGAPEGEPGASAGGAGAAQPGTETWATGIEALFAERCLACHDDETRSAFKVTSLEEVLKHVTAGDPENSNVIGYQAAGTHPGQFTEEEITRIIEWILAGAQ